MLNDKQYQDHILKISQIQNIQAKDHSSSKILDQSVTNESCSMHNTKDRDSVGKRSSQSIFKKFSPLKFGSKTTSPQQNNGSKSKRSKQQQEQIQTASTQIQPFQLSNLNHHTTRTHPQEQLSENVSPFAAPQYSFGVLNAAFGDQASSFNNYLQPIQSESPQPKPKTTSSAAAAKQQDNPYQSNASLNRDRSKSSTKKRKSATKQTESKIGILENENQQLKNQIEVLRAALLNLCGQSNLTNFTKEVVVSDSNKDAIDEQSKAQASCQKTKSPRKSPRKGEAKENDLGICGKEALTKCQLSPVRKQLSYRAAQDQYQAIPSSRRESKSPKKLQIVNDSHQVKRPSSSNALQRRRRSQRKGASKSRTPRRQLSSSNDQHQPLNLDQITTFGVPQQYLQSTTEMQGEPVIALQSNRSSQARNKHQRSQSRELNPLFKLPSVNSGGLLTGFSPSKHIVALVNPQLQSVANQQNPVVQSIADPVFYEKQISTLKNELVIFEQEEKKIINLLFENSGQQAKAVVTGVSESIDDSSLLVIQKQELKYNEMPKQHYTAQNSAIQKQHNDELTVFRYLESNCKKETRPFSVNGGEQQQCQFGADKSTTEIAEHDMKLFEEIRMMEEQKEDKHLFKEQQSIKEASHQHEEMLKNLQDVFSFINSQPRYCPQSREGEECCVIKPIKITSPCIQSTNHLPIYEDEMESASPNKSQEQEKLTSRPSGMLNINNNQLISREANQCRTNRESSIESTPRCSALLHPHSQLQYFPQSNIKQQSLLNTAKLQDVVPHFDMVAASVPTKNNNNYIYDDQTPQVIPYEVEETQKDDESVREPLRVKSPERKSIVFDLAQSIVQAQRASLIEKHPLFDEQDGPSILERLPNHALIVERSQIETIVSIQNSARKFDQKQDRTESIRRAEEMLSQFLREQQFQSSKRPEFLRNRKGLAKSSGGCGGGNGSPMKDVALVSHAAERFSFSPLINGQQDKQQQIPIEESLGFDPQTIEDQDKIIRMQQAINNISFQQTSREGGAPENWFSPPPFPEPVVQQSEKPQVPMIISSPEVSSCYYGDLINLQIKPSSQQKTSNDYRNSQPSQNVNPYRFQVEMQTYNFKSFDEQQYDNNCATSLSGSKGSAKRTTVAIKSHLVANSWIANNESPSQKIDQRYLEPKIIKQPTPLSRCGNNTASDIFEGTQTSFEESHKKSMHSPSMSSGGVFASGGSRKKLSTGHKVKKPCSSERTPNNTSVSAYQHKTPIISAVQQEQIKNFIQSSGSAQVSAYERRMQAQKAVINYTQPSRKVQKSPMQSNNKIIKSGNNQLSQQANSSLISNALFLAKQLQCLQNSQMSGLPNESLCSSNFTSSKHQFKSHALENQGAKPSAEVHNFEISSFRPSTDGNGEQPIVNASQGKQQQKRGTSRSGLKNIGSQLSSRDSILAAANGVQKIRPLRNQKVIHPDASVCSHGSGNSTNGTKKPNTKRGDASTTSSVYHTTALSNQNTTKSTSATGTNKMSSAYSQSNLFSFEKRCQALKIQVTQNNYGFATPTTNEAAQMLTIHIQNQCEDRSEAVRTPKLVQNKMPNIQQSLSRRGASSELSAPNRRKSGIIAGTKPPQQTLEAHCEQQPEINCDKLTKYVNKKPIPSVKPSNYITKTTPAQESKIRPGQQQIKEYYQLKREHERIRNVLQQTAIDMNSSGRLFFQHSQQVLHQANSINNQASMVSSKGAKKVRSKRNVAQIDVSPSTQSYTKVSVANNKNNNNQRQALEQSPEEIEPVYEFNNNHYFVQQQAHPSQKRICLNCERLKSQGLSTQFCLDHSIEQAAYHQFVHESAKDGGTANNNSSVRAYNEDLHGCHVIYIDSNNNME